MTESSVVGVSCAAALPTREPTAAAVIAMATNAFFFLSFWREPNTLFIFNMFVFWVF